MKKVKNSKNLYKLFIISQIIVIVFTANPVLAQTDNLFFELNISEKIGRLLSQFKRSYEFKNTFPVSEDRVLEIVKEGHYTLTAYNSDPYQCDNSPCITANGFNVCEHGIEDTIAANFLKFGTKVRIPELYGDKIFIVRDRMNSRYQNRIDIWMLEKQDAKEFGAKIAKIEVLEYSNN